MAVTVSITKSAQKDFDKLQPTVKADVAAVLAILPNYPAVPHVKALQGKLKGTYRVKVGRNFRILFTLGAGTLTVVGIDDRKDAY